MTDKVEVVVGDIFNQEDQSSMLRMLDLYMQDPMGGGRPLDKQLGEQNIANLKKQTNYVFFLAKVNGEVAGLANCFIGFSTFKAKQLINIHDFAVDPAFRRRGIGEAMMDRIFTFCKENDMCKVTLEVRFDNPVAQNLYKKKGFDAGDPPYHFWEKTI